MNTNLVTMVDSLRTGKAGEAQSAFERVMAEKVNAALDQQKIAVAGQIYNNVQEAGPKVKVSVKKPIGHKIADIGPGGKEYNVKTKDWPQSDTPHDSRPGWAGEPKAGQSWEDHLARSNID